MGFYGKVFQGLSNAFRSFTFRNKNTKGIEFPEEQRLENEIVVEAGTIYDSALIQSGNQWIQIASMGEGQVNGCEFYHGAPDVENLTTLAALSNVKVYDLDNLTAEEKAEREELKDNKNTYLDFGTKLTFSILDFDKAGHVSTIGSKDFLMAESPDLNLGKDLERRVQNLEYVMDPDLDNITTLDDIKDTEKYPEYKEDVISRLEGLEESEILTHQLWEYVVTGTKEPEAPGALEDIDNLQIFAKRFETMFDGYTTSFHFLTGTNVDYSIPRFLGAISNIDTGLDWADTNIKANMIKVLGNFNDIRGAKVPLFENKESYSGAIIGINEKIDKEVIPDININQNAILELQGSRSIIYSILDFNPVDDPELKNTAIDKLEARANSLENINNQNGITFETNLVPRVSTLETLLGALTKTHTSDVNALQSSLAAETAERKEADTQIRSDLGQSISDTKTELTNLIDNTKDSLNNSINTIKSELDTKDIELNSLISANKTAIETETTNRTNSIAELRNMLENADSALSGRIDQVTQNLSTTDLNLTNEIANRATSEQALSDRIDATNTNVTNLTNRVSINETNISNLQANVEDLQNADAAIIERLETLENKEDLTPRVEALENDTSLQTEVDTLKETVSNLSAQLEEALNRIATLEQSTSPEETP